MFVVEVHTVYPKRGYVSGIFKEKLSAARYLEGVPEELRSEQVMRSIPIDSYPIYAVECFDSTEQCCSLELVDYSGLQKCIAGIERNPELEKIDHQYMLVTCFEGDWQLPKGRAGKDYTWSPPHAHIDRDFLNSLDKYGEVNCGFRISKPSLT